jgi:hypothetical protein
MGRSSEDLKRQRLVDRFRTALLNLLRSRGASYLVATPKRLSNQFEKELLARGLDPGVEARSSL